MKRVVTMLAVAAILTACARSLRRAIQREWFDQPWSRSFDLETPFPVKSGMDNESRTGRPLTHARHPHVMQGHRFLGCHNERYRVQGRSRRFAPRLVPDNVSRLAGV